MAKTDPGGVQWRLRWHGNEERPSSMENFALFAVIGFLAQLIDGSLGMGYGAVSSATLLAAGVPPAQTSASVHAAKLFTSGTSGLSHLVHGNVDRAIFLRLAIAGAVAGAVGALMVSVIPAALIRPVAVTYLVVIGAVIVYRAWIGTHPAHRLMARPRAGLIGAVAGFVDGTGGGGWGPVATSSLIGSGVPARQAVGSVNAAEFFVTAAVLTAFATAAATGIWGEAGQMVNHAAAVAGLIAGGIPAAIIAGYLPKHVGGRKLSGAVGCLVIVLAVQQFWMLVR